HSYGRMVLRINDLDMDVWDSLNQKLREGDTSDSNENLQELQEKIYFEIPVGSHRDFKLMAWFESLTERELYTSKIFISGLSVLAILI
ncbi:GGDEF-domain containing protein, partial [Vibrio astriarenae]